MAEKELSGVLSRDGPELTGMISPEGGLTGVLSYSTDNTAEIYKGSYEVVSDTEDDSYLLTKLKLLTDNVTVKKIPYSETLNISGGVTAYIG